MPTFTKNAQHVAVLWAVQFRQYLFILSRLPTELKQLRHSVNSKTPDSSVLPVWLIELRTPLFDFVMHCPSYSMNSMRRIITAIVIATVYISCILYITLVMRFMPGFGVPGGMGWPGWTGPSGFTGHTGWSQVCVHFMHIFILFHDFY